MSNFKKLIYIPAITLCSMLFSAMFATAQQQTDLSVKEASIVKQPITSKQNEIKVIVANNDKKKADKIVVTVYAIPALICRINNVTLVTNVFQAVENGKLTESNFIEFFGSNEAWFTIFKLKEKASVQQFINSKSQPSWMAWAQSSQQINLEPNASQTLNFKMPLAYVPTVTGNQKQDKENKIIKLFNYYQSTNYNLNGELIVFAAAAKKLVFSQSVFYIDIKGGVDKNAQDNTSFIAPQLLQQN